MRVRKLTFAALAVAAGLSLTACQNDDDGTAQSDPSSASTSASSGGGSDQGGGQGTVAGTGSNENGEVGKCRTDELEFKAIDHTVDGDPDGTVAVELTNGGGRDCAISGYAGVDLKTSAGSLSAERSGEEVTPGVLKDGESVAFGINYPINDSGGSGVRITGLVVTPPDETKSVTLDWPGAPTLPVTDGSGSPVKVGPMGSAGQGG
ncbi:DUF4232 domain-containing protein [Streptomyces acidicola]|uniref:DUF4232 domain-containing protein n=1 Tax=Streptomyces acidicola TaxID=2596892 RepID=UPI0034286771